MASARMCSALCLFATLAFCSTALGRNVDVTDGDPKPQQATGSCQAMIEGAAPSATAADSEQGLAQLSDLVQRRLGGGVALSGDRLGLRVELRQGARRVRLSAGPAGGALAVHWRF